MVDRELITKDCDHQRIFLRLDTFLDQALSEEEAIVAATHISSCELCQQHVAKLLGVKRIFFVNLDESGPIPEYPASLFEHLQSAASIHEAYG